MNSIRQQLTVALLGVFAALLGAGSMLIYFSTRAALLAQVDARLRVEAIAVAKQTKQDKDDGDQADKHEPLRGSRDTRMREVEVGFNDKYMPEFDAHGTEFFQVWSPDGNTVKRSDSLHKKDLERRSGTVEKPVFWNLTLPNGIDGRAVGITFVPPSSPKQRQEHDPGLKATLVIATELAGLNKTLVTMRGVLFGVCALSLLATLATVPLTLKRGLVSLQAVAGHAAALQVSTLPLAGFPTERMPTELRPICLRLNELLVRLELSFERERRFSADVAHELRTPIAELRSTAEVALKWPESVDSQSATLEEVLAISHQMESLVASLLSISRCEAGSQSIVCESICLESFTTECWRCFGVQAQQNGIEAHLTLVPEIKLESDRALLGMILTNLFSNAVTYTPRGGMIDIRADGLPNSILSVTNTFGNLSAHDLPHIFDRFWRKDAARSSSEHSGLGLALAKCCAEVLRLKLTAEFAFPNQLRMTLHRL